MRNIWKIADNAQINEYYDIMSNQVRELLQLDKLEAITIAFNYGYAMGARATKAERKRARQ